MSRKPSNPHHSHSREGCLQDSYGNKQFNLHTLLLLQLTAQRTSGHVIINLHGYILFASEWVWSVRVVEGAGQNASRGASV